MLGIPGTLSLNPVLNLSLARLPEFLRLLLESLNCNLSRAPMSLGIRALALWGIIGVRGKSLKPWVRRGSPSTLPLRAVAVLGSSQ